LTIKSIYFEKAALTMVMLIWGSQKYTNASKNRVKYRMGSSFLRPAELAMPEIKGIPIVTVTTM